MLKINNSRNMTGFGQIIGICLDIGNITDWNSLQKHIADIGCHNLIPNFCLIILIPKIIKLNQTGLVH